MIKSHDSFSEKKSSNFYIKIQGVSKDFCSQELWPLLFLFWFGTQQNWNIDILN